MTLFRLTAEPPAFSILVRDDLLLRSPALGDYEQWASLREKSREFLAPWEPVWPEDDLTRLAFRRRIERYMKERLADQSYAVFLFRMPDEVLLGGLTLSQVRRGVAQSGNIGYWIGEPYAHQGWMTAALCAFIDHAFDTLKLERLEAATLPHNEPSIKLLLRVGFQKEGLAKRYLRIAGARQDHILFGLLPEDFNAAPAP